MPSTGREYSPVSRATEGGRSFQGTLAGYDVAHYPSWPIRLLKPITRYPAAVQGPMPPLNSGPLTLPNPRTHSTRRPIPGDARHPRHPAGTKAGKARARTRGLSDVGKVAYHKARGALWLVVSVQNRYSYGTIEVHGVKRGERICTGSFGRFFAFLRRLPRG